MPAVLINEVESGLPEFAKLCNSDEVDMVILSQACFGLSDADLMLMARAIKYAGFKGKDVTIIC